MMARYLLLFGALLSDKRRLIFSLKLEVSRVSSLDLIEASLERTKSWNLCPRRHAYQLFLLWITAQ